MFQKFFTRIFGSRNDRLIKTYQKAVQQINALESSISALDDVQLSQKTGGFRQRIANGELLEALLPEAFAVCREAARRVLGMRHFDVQLLGGMVLHDGKIAEMRTGEGKTLTATLPVYLNALAGKGVHVVTVNDYLASRDSEWMGRLYQFLGLSVGVVSSQQPSISKKEAYAADITYGTNNEFGFDYLRDNMEYSVDGRRQRGLSFAIIDEVDSILVDEARTPLIISGLAEDNARIYEKVNPIPSFLMEMSKEPESGEEEPPGDYWVDRKSNQVHLSEAGHEKAEKLLGEIGLLPDGTSLYDSENIGLMHHVLAALRAHTLYRRDQQYVVQNDEVVIVDEFTGRLMVGRRWSDGLHQAVEAKEAVRIQPENQTLASITFQNYFRLYEKLAGMTGTADTEAFEFQEIYGLETVVVPTHRPMIRQDRQDQIFRTAEEKIEAIVHDIEDSYNRGQPVLVGTTSIENSEQLSRHLSKISLPHQVLNAKQHAREAEVISQAGRPKMITIATNMAGRGTDIVLGGSIEHQIEAIQTNPHHSEDQKEMLIAELKKTWQQAHDQVVAAGGLHVIGTERHESRRIDNQLRGRSGRQGDPGSSRFYLSMEDPLLQIFGGDRLRSIMDRLRLPKGEPIEAGIVTRSIESAQRRVEARNFDVRKQLLEYDDVANEQRKIIYADRNNIMVSSDLTERLADMRSRVFREFFRKYIREDSLEEEWDFSGLKDALKTEWGFDGPFYERLAQLFEKNADKTFPSDDALLEKFLNEIEVHFSENVISVGNEAFLDFERSVLLGAIDLAWREHLSNLEYLRQGIHLRGYAQKNPKEEYKLEAFSMFLRMQQRIRSEVSRILVSVSIDPGSSTPVSKDATTSGFVPSASEQSTIQLSSVNANKFLLPLEAFTVEPFQGGARQVLTPGFEKNAWTNSGEEQLASASVASDAAKAQIFSPPPARNELCPCRSGKKYKHCHGAL